MFSPVGLSCACRHSMNRLSQEGQAFQRAILSCHTFFFMIACTSKLYNDSQSTNHFHAFFF